MTAYTCINFAYMYTICTISNSIGEFNNSYL